MKKDTLQKVLFRAKLGQSDHRVVEGRSALFHSWIHGKPISLSFKEEKLK
jgi:hypothetical protein